MTVRAAWLTSSGQTRGDTRLTLASLLTPSGDSPDAAALRSLSGVLPGGLALTGVSSMQCSIGTGRAIVQGKETAQGAYLVAVTSPETLTIADGDPQNPRIDLIELAVLDDDFDQTGETRAVIRIVKGTPAETPQPPASGPGSTMPLYQLRVPTSTSAGTGGITWSTATSVSRPVVALGGITPGYGFNGAYAGQYRESFENLQRWDGNGGWISYPKSIGGIAPIGQIFYPSYTGQYRDTAGGLQRFDGTTWQHVDNRSKLLFSVAAIQGQAFTPNNTTAALLLHRIEVDDAQAWSGASTYTVPRAGWWRISPRVLFQPEGTTGTRIVRLHVNGALRNIWQTVDSTVPQTLGSDYMLKLAAGNTLQIVVSGSTTARTIASGVLTSTFQAEWLKP
ncbi:hypothetical protein [Streptomyces sp. NPDC090025]|uniref:hypothetical protein n=1 Tax=Streptomyces sp. NPDC090025 TaxID=3365922 RepID=UPI0038342C2B